MTTMARSAWGLCGWTEGQAKGTGQAIVVSGFRGKLVRVVVAYSVWERESSGCNNH